KPLNFSTVATSVPAGTVNAFCQTLSGSAYTTVTLAWLVPPFFTCRGGPFSGPESGRASCSVVIACMSSLCERVDEAGGDTIENRPNHHFKGTIRKSVVHGVEHLAGIGRQLLELPGA